MEGGGDDPNPDEEDASTRAVLANCGLDLRHRADQAPLLAHEHKPNCAVCAAHRKAKMSAEERERSTMSRQGAAAQGFDARMCAGVSGNNVRETEDGPGGSQLTRADPQARTIWHRLARPIRLRGASIP